MTSTFVPSSSTVTWLRLKCLGICRRVSALFSKRRKWLAHFVKCELLHRLLADGLRGGLVF
jgi:hypothetical protein